MAGTGPQKRKGGEGQPQPELHCRVTRPGAHVEGLRGRGREGRKGDSDVLTPSGANLQVSDSRGFALYPTFLIRVSFYSGFPASEGRRPTNGTSPESWTSPGAKSAQGPPQPGLPTWSSGHDGLEEGPRARRALRAAAASAQGPLHPPRGLSETATGGPRSYVEGDTRERGSAASGFSEATCAPLTAVSRARPNPAHVGQGAAFWTQSPHELGQGLLVP